MVTFYVALHSILRLSCSGAFALSARATLPVLIGLVGLACVTEEQAMIRYEEQRRYQCSIMGSLSPFSRTDAQR